MFGLSLGLSEEELLARRVCRRLTKVMGDSRERGEEIAVASADLIIEKVRLRWKNEKLVEEIKKELLLNHPDRGWTFKKR